MFSEYGPLLACTRVMVVAAESGRQCTEYGNVHSESRDVDVTHKLFLGIGESNSLKFCVESDILASMCTDCCSESTSACTTSTVG